MSLYIVIRNFTTKEVVNILAPGDEFDALKFMVIDKGKNLDVTEELIKAR